MDIRLKEKVKKKKVLLLGFEPIYSHARDKR